MFQLGRGALQNSGSVKCVIVGLCLWPIVLASHVVADTLGTQGVSYHPALSAHMATRTLHICFLLDQKPALSCFIPGAALSAFLKLFACCQSVSCNFMYHSLGFPLLCCVLARPRERSCVFNHIACTHLA